MFKNKKAVVYITKDNLRAGLVTARPPFKVSDLVESSWKPENLQEVLNQTKDKLKIKKVRILLGSEFSYVVKTTIPTETKKENERQTIAEVIAKEIPEILDSQDWDYKTIGKNKEYKKIIVFAPVKDKFALISQAFFALNLEIEAVEPENIAKTRHENPMIGLALKRDLKGKDEEVLNLEPVKVIKKFAGKLRQNNKKIFFIIFLAVLLGVVITGGVIFGRKVFKKEKDTLKPAVEAVSPSPSEIKESAKTTAVLPSITSVPKEKPNKKDLKIKVLNGNGLEGSATKLASFLEDRGYQNIETGNADSYNYEETVIKIRKSKTEYLDIIGTDLDYKYSTENIQIILDKDIEFDVIFVVGKE